MLHKEFWGLVFLAFVVWIFLAPDPDARIARTCRPLEWGGNVAVSLTAFAVPRGADSVQKWTSRFEYGCRYTIWRLFYQKNYNEYMENLKRQGNVPPLGAPGTTAEPGSETPAAEPEDTAPPPAGDAAAKPAVVEPPPGVTP